jgi:hypothetical protein
MRSTVRLAALRGAGALLLALGIALFCFLAVWFWEIFLWFIFGPLAVGSLYAGWKLVRPSEAASRAVIYWAIALLWTLAVVMIAFKDTTLLGGAIAVVVAAGTIAGLYVLAQKPVAAKAGFSQSDRHA